MRINRIKLANACLHEALDVSLGTGLIGVFGPQGSGKSTMLNLAYAALTNDYSRIEGGKEGAVRQQADGKEPSKIEVWASHNDAEFHLSRRLAPSSSHSLIIGDAPAIKKANEIQAILDEALGSDRQTLDRYVFVEQWGLRAIFQQTAAERAKTLSHLCNTGHAEVCWDLVGKQIELDAKLATAIEDNTDELRQQMGQEKAAAASLQQLITKEAPYLLSDEQVSQLRDELDRCVKRTFLADQLQELQDREPALLMAAKTATKHAKEQAEEFEKQQQALAQATECLHQARTQWDRHQELLAAWKSHLAAQQEVVAAEQNLAALQPPAAPTTKSLSELDAKLTLIRGKIEPKKAQINQWQGMLNQFGQKVSDSAPNCPACGQSLDAVRDKMGELAARVAAATKELQMLTADETPIKALRAAVVDYEKQCALYEQRLGYLQSTLQACRSRFAVMPFAQDPGNAEEVGSAVAKATTQKQIAERVVQAAQRDSKVTEQVKATAIANHKALKRQIEETASKLAEYADVPASTDASSKLAAHHHAAMETAKLQERLTAKEESQKSLQAEIDRIERVLARSRLAQHWQHVLSRVRSVLHRDQLPRMVHHAALQSMEAQINETLEMFESPFRVTTSDDLSYVAHFRNGTVMPAKGLSGGQQVVLAIAFRWVLNSLFASQIGMMVLDEPTAGLDRRHVDLLETALRALGANARSRGCQVIIVTHELSLEDVFDQTIRLGKAVA